MQNISFLQYHRLNTNILIVSWGSVAHIPIFNFIVSLKKSLYFPEKVVEKNQLPFPFHSNI